MENKRQEIILELISNESISTQEELVGRLRSEGFSVTQATVSRDIRQLGLKKEKVGDNICYVLPKREKDIPERFERVLKEGFVSSDIAMNILVIKTVSGMAMAVAAALDAYHFPELVGCIAGDDTVMCAIKDVASTKRLQKKIDELVK